MKLSEIFNQLAYGELSQTGMVDSTTGLMITTKYGQLVSHVNLGLTALHKRFPLKEGRLTLALQAGRLTYPLNTSDDVIIIEGGEGDEEFNDDILKIERVYSSSGTELGLNNEANPLSCFTPKATVLRVPALIVDKSLDLPSELQTDTLTVVYRANHAILAAPATLNPARVEVDLPYSHLEPLLLYVASRIMTPMGAGQFEGQGGNNYYAKYEASCAHLESTNLRVDQDSQNSRMERNGWV